MHRLVNKYTKTLSISIMTVGIGLTGCQTIKNFTGGESKSAIQTAENSEQGYYQSAIDSINSGHKHQAIKDLTNLRTFYPTGSYAKKALLDLMYLQFDKGEYPEAAASAQQFIKLYPTHPQVDYAYYVRGVANMQGTSDGLRIFNLNQAERDTSYYRLAFANFVELINRYPNSQYAPDAAQRMTYIYNQFAEHEISVARWYIEREAYVAAAKRAKWVFQYYPKSQSTPEAIAILAYTNQKLGLNDLSNQYKSLLQINYPQWLTSNGDVNLSIKRDRSWLNKLTFGQLSRFDKSTNSQSFDGQYNGQTKTQIIQNASQMRLPPSAN